MEDFRPVTDSRLPAQDVLKRNLRIPEDQPPRPAPARAHQSIDMLHLHTGSALDQESRHRLFRIVDALYLAVDQDQVRALGTDYKTFLASQVEVVPFAAGARGGRKEIGATTWLG